MELYVTAIRGEEATCPVEQGQERLSLEYSAGNDTVVITLRFQDETVAPGIHLVELELSREDVIAITTEMLRHPPSTVAPKDDIFETIATAQYREKGEESWYYENWSSADLTGLDETDYDVFDMFCQDVEPDEPERINRFNFIEHLRDLLLVPENYFLLKHRCPETIGEDDDYFVETLFQNFRFERDCNHWLLNVGDSSSNRGMYVIDFATTRVLPMEPYYKDDFYYGDHIGEAEKSSVNRKTSQSRRSRSSTQSKSPGRSKAASRAEIKAADRAEKERRAKATPRRGKITATESGSTGVPSHETLQKR